MRVAPPSLAPYSSQISVAGNAAMIRRFTSTGHGAAPCTISRRLDRSYFAALLLRHFEDADEVRGRHEAQRHTVRVDEP